MATMTGHQETTGEIVGFALPDVIQVNQHNRFSGCIAVESTAGSGLLFFREGEIIHAEQGGRTGEAAFLELLSWPPGRYRLQHNVATTRATIQKATQHLLLDAARMLDERRAGRPPPAAPEPAAAPSRPPLRSTEVLERLRRIPSVIHAAIHTREGVSVGDGSFESEALGGQALFLAMLGSQLTGPLQSGPVVSAAVQGTKHHLLVLSTRTHFVSFLVSPDAQVGAVEAEVRRLLAAPR